MADKKPKQGGGTASDKVTVKVTGSNKTMTGTVKGGQRVATKATKGGSSGGGKKK